MTNKKKIPDTTAAYEKNQRQQQAYKMPIAASQITTIYEDNPYPTIKTTTDEATPLANWRSSRTRITPRTRRTMTQKHNSYDAFVALQCNTTSSSRVNHKTNATATTIHKEHCTTSTMTNNTKTTPTMTPRTKNLQQQLQLQ